MVDLRVRCHSRYLVKTAAIVLVLIGVADTARGGTWDIEDTRYNVTADYDYQAKIYEVINGNPNHLFGEEYDYVGQTYHEQYGWVYKWTLDQELITPGNPEPDAVMGGVEQRYLGGSWSSFDVIYGVLRP